MLGHMIDPNTPEHYFKWTATKPKNQPFLVHKIANSWTISMCRWKSKLVEAEIFPV